MKFALEVPKAIQRRTPGSLHIPIAAQLPANELYSTLLDSLTARDGVAGGARVAIVVAVTPGAGDVPKFLSGGSLQLARPKPSRHNNESI